MRPMNKKEIVASILEQLREEFENRNRVSKITREVGNDAESKAEGKYDTLAIEENYLADGLAKQALAAAEAMAEIEKMPLRTFTGDHTRVPAGLTTDRISRRRPNIGPVGQNYPGGISSPPHNAEARFQTVVRLHAPVLERMPLHRDHDRY